jgi:starvation-inducible DNA-binding protein
MAHLLPDNASQGSLVGAAVYLLVPQNSETLVSAHRRGLVPLRGEHRDIAAASLLENWIDEAGRRTWFLFEATRVREE